MGTVLISNSSLSWTDLSCLLESSAHFRISRDRRSAIQNSYKILKNILINEEQVYGVNTGFGKLSNVSIQPKDLNILQLNLVRSHASGVGKPLHSGVVRIIMVLKLITWAKGFSGIRPELSQLLLDMLKRQILPVIPSKGSVGASGDLAPLAHMACAMIGESDVNYKGKIISSKLALR